MTTHLEDNIRLRSQRVADLTSETADLERRLFDTRMSLERELAHQPSWESAHSPGHRAHRHAPVDAGGDLDADGMSDFYAGVLPPLGYDHETTGGQARSPDGRTEVLVNRGRRSAYHQGLSPGRKAGVGTAVVAALLAGLVMTFSGHGASWPASVARVQSEAAKACQNPDVESEPGQVNFACAKKTRQILWVFALLTSSDNPSFTDIKTGRVGLEPITPAQGGEVAWSLNIHHPYNPANPIDSLEVAARAINNIIGGATVTGANGKPVVQSGLEGHAANCVRYTGSAALTSRAGFPRLCAKPVTSPAGQAALVADVYQKWVVGAGPEAAQDAAVLFGNASNPSDPRVQTILKQLPNSHLLG